MTDEEERKEFWAGMRDMAWCWLLGALTGFVIFLILLWLVSHEFPVVHFS